MFKRWMKVVPLALMLSAGAASAKTYNITGVIDGVANGFGSSLFHDQYGGRMSGSEVDDPLNASGTWNSHTGAINFTMDLEQGGSVTVTGNLLVNESRISSIGSTGVYTASPLQFAFSAASQFGATIMNFSFADVFHNPEANGVKDGVISLWGDNGVFNEAQYQYGSYSYNKCGYNGYNCLGTDLRLQIAAVPLPASMLLLLGGIGGLAGLRRFKSKKAA